MNNFMSNTPTPVPSTFEEHQQQPPAWPQLVRPTNLTLLTPNNSHLLTPQNQQQPNTHNDQSAPQINITITDTCNDHQHQPDVEYDSDLYIRVENSRSPSFLGYMTSQSSLAITPTDIQPLTLLSTNQETNRDG